MSASPECMDQVRFIACYYTFPGCDRSTSVLRPKKFCKESCLHFTNECSRFVNAWKEILLPSYPEKAALFSCLEKPSRNAGESPECVYYDRKESVEKEDCVYLDGSSYYGNISVTASNIPCQTWTDQCPHRHTMNKTYPELNNANNYCRNPQNSGKQPWCFTTDKNKRWEYCDIPKCISVDGSYSNWSLNGTCNVICGDGFETWSRECNNPEPKYGGRNCSHLGKPVEYRQCTKKPCVVNGGYSSWNLSSQCNVTCGQEVEIWRRSCNNPTPKNGGRNCTVLGEDIKRIICERRPCPIDGNYSNWTTSSACSVTCGVGYQIWFRECDNPPPTYGGKDCSKYGKDKDSRPCHLRHCSVTSRSAKVIRIAYGVCVPIIIMAIGFFLIRKRNVLMKRFKRAD
ncbi:partial, partial [Paramuricea clavata]